MNIIIPLCGKGERFRHMSSLPKHMLPIAGKPMITYLLDRLVALTPQPRIYIIYHTRFHEHGFHTLMNTLYPQVTLIPIDYQTQGAAETIHYGLKHIYGPGLMLPTTPAAKTVLMDCDTFYLGDVMDKVAQHQGNGLVYFQQAPADPFSGYSYVTLTPDGTNTLTDIREKERISDNANTGIYIFQDPATLFTYIKHTLNANVRFKNEYYTSTVIHAMIQDGHTFCGIEIPQHHMVSLGTPEQATAFEQSLHAFLFDLDGTLVNSDPLYQKVWSRLLAEELEFPETPATFNDFIAGNNDASALRKLDPHITDADIARISQRKDDLFLEHIHEVTPLPGALDFIHSLRCNTPHKIAVVTNCNRRVAEQVLDHLGLSPLIDGLIIGNECAFPKPYPHPYEHALHMLGNIPHTHAIIFEDSPSGLLSGHGVFPKCLVQVSPQAQQEQHHPFANITVADFTTLSPIDLLSYDATSHPLQALLEVNLPDAQRIYIHNTKLKGGFIADVVGVDVYSQPGNRKRECVIKLQSHNDTTKLAQMASKLGLYEREYYFYEHVRPHLPSHVHAPECHAIIRDPQGTPQGILLERLSPPDYVINLDLNHEPTSVSLTIIERMAQLHAHFIPFASSFPELKKNNDPLFCPTWELYVQERWPLFKTKWSHLLTPQQLARGDHIVSTFHDIQRQLSEGPTLTLIHGDIKSPNIFYKMGSEEKEPYFIDWQYIALGKGVQDLVFFMIESFDTATIRQHAPIFKRHYYDEFIKALPHTIPYTCAEFEHDCHLAACYYPFFVAVWFGTMDTEDLIDVNFPVTFIQKLWGFLGA